MPRPLCNGNQSIHPKTLSFALQASYEELLQTAFAEAIRAYKLHGIRAEVFYLYQMKVRLLHDDYIFTSPAEILVVEINNVTNC